MTPYIPSSPRLTRRLLLGGSLAGVALGIAGCGTDSATSGASSASASATASADGKAASGSVAALAQAFYQTLDADQQATVLQDYSLDNAKRWSNLPQNLLGGTGGGAPSGSGSSGSGAPTGSPPGGSGSGAPGGSSSGSQSGSAPGGSGSQSGGGNSTRLGLSLGDLNDDQLAAFDAALKAATGSSSGLGYDEIQTHLYADDYLADNGGGEGYGRANYYVALLGSPQDSGTWEFQFGGHHLAVANTYTDGSLVGATPAFRGIEPNGDFEWEGSTYNALKVKEDALAALLTGLSSEQQKTATLSDTFSDLVLGPGNDWSFPSDRVGIQVSALDDAQRKLVLAAIASYVDDVADADAKTILAKYEDELDETFVAYSGSAELTERNDYVRIDGPSVWIEFSMQNGIVLSGVHPHSVWRDRTTDYGGTKS